MDGGQQSSEPASASDAAADGARQPRTDAARADSDANATINTGDPAADAGLSTDAPGADGDSGAGTDGGEVAPQADAGAAPDDGQDSGNGGILEPPADAGSACTPPLRWFPDEDEDGYGRPGAPTSACAKPAGNWSQRSGDCNDADARMHPEQTLYFGTASSLPDGRQSFDYDCSGLEDGDALQQAAPDDCGALSLALCTGSGYAKTPRAGWLENPYCGSTIKKNCQASLLDVLICASNSEAVSDPYRCK